MAPSHMQVLAEQIYNEKTVVTYRLLSRLLGVHVNLAKQMLHEFHGQAKLDGKPCHATYILSGLVEQLALPQDDVMQIEGDDFMMSSPPVPTQESSKSSEAGSKLVRTVILADETEIQDAKKAFTELTSIHVYSLAHAPVQDPVLLTTCSYDISSKYDTNMAPMEIAQKYGVIANSNAVKRELTKYVPPPVVVGTAMSKRKPTGLAKVTSKETTPPPETIKQSTAEPQPHYHTGYPTNRGRETKPSTMKRTSSGSIMNAFANAPPRRSKPKPDEAPEPPKPKLPPKVSAKRQKELDEVSKMMEESEPEELEDFPHDAPPMEDSQDTVMTTESPATPATDVAAEEPKRKRGKRKILKKTTKRDEKGYLVTKNEWVYESFSEDDEEAEVAPKIKKPVVPVHSATTAVDKKKGKAGAGQKSLISFFGKK